MDASKNSLDGKVAPVTGGSRGIGRAIAPRPVKTRFSEPLWREWDTGERAAENTTLGRLGLPENVAQVTFFLASDAPG